MATCRKRGGQGKGVALSRESITQLLLDWGEGDQEALDQLIPQVYDELHRMAVRRMGCERSNHTLQPTALVNELYVRLVDQNRARWRNRAQFFAIAARVMRRILVDHARGRKARPLGSKQVSLEAVEPAMSEKDVDVLAVDEALGGLAERDPRKARIMEMRVFGGLTIEETAEVLDVSIGTVKNDYRFAKAWMVRRLRQGE